MNFPTNIKKINPKLDLLLKKRHHMKTKIKELKEIFSKNEINPARYYQRIERLSLHLFQINSDIQNLDPSQNSYLNDVLQL